MATRSVRTERVVVQKYYWPENQLNFWWFIMLATGGTILGVFAAFINIQQQMKIGIPWLFPYGVTVGAITIVFIIILLILINQRNLTPRTMILGAFILLVLYLAGLVETAIQLFGAGNVNSSCQNYVNKQQVTGVSIETLAYLQQNSICSSWDAAFAFWIVGTVFLIWMIVMASQVNRQ